MIDWLKKRGYSKQYIYATVLALLTVVQSNLPLLEGYLKDNFGWVMFVNVIIVAVLREVTKKPLSEKAEFKLIDRQD